ncbi:putative importin 11 [Pestalotiopsis sp. NC0098]|nr:putative importin 11 [Pestalotiopsis sp. NC0098]
MSFAIEVPGEASPLSFQELCRSLQLASSSPDHTQRQSAGQQLSSWEQTQVDYYPSLQHIFLDKSLPREVRLLAIIQLKNGVDKNWRHHTIQNAIQPAQKEVIRSNLYRGSVGEEDKQLAMHNALVVAKITRIDFPQAWPEAMSNLVSLLRETKDGDAFKLSGALVVLLRVVKELGTARMRKSQTALQSVTPELVYILGEIYTSSTATWTSSLANGQGDEFSLETAMQNSLTAFKTLRRLLITGYEYPHKDSTVQQAWGLSQAQFDQFLDYAGRSSTIPDHLLEIIGKHMMQFTKLHVEMAVTHPASFSSLPNSLELTRAYWTMVKKFAAIYPRSGGLRRAGAEELQTNFSLEGQWLEKIALKGLLLCRACIKMVNQPQQTFKYRSKEERSDQDALIQTVKDDLLNSDFIVDMANTIISNFLVFRETDLEAWIEDPEEWEQQEESGGNAWEWEVRPCAEQVLRLLLVSYKHLLVEPLLGYFQRARDPEADIMLKESIYTALGISASYLEKQFDFDEFLRSTLVSDAQQQGDLCKVLRRRIAILISEWAKVSMGKESFPLIYEIYRHFLNPNDETNDIVVRITGARQFKDIASQFTFNGEAFAPFAEGILTQLIQLLQEIEIDETKLAILDTTRVIIERMETHVNPFADLIISALPAIWESGGDMEYMLKQAALTILQSLVMSMRQDSQRFHTMITPLIHDVVREDSSVLVYLIDETLDLWINILYQSSSPLSPELISLVEPALRLLNDLTEHNLSYVTIIGSYVLLAPQVMLEDRWRQPLLKGLCQTLQRMPREQQRCATKYIEHLIRYGEQFGQLDGVKVVVRDLVACGFMKEMLEGIHDAYSAHQTSGPKRRTPKINNLTLTDYFSILSRIAVADPSIAVEILGMFGSLEQVWPWLSDEWFNNFDCISDNTRRKLNLLGLTRLMELGQPIQDLVLGKLQEYLSMWISVISSIANEEDPAKDDLVLTEPMEATEWDTPKDLCERALRESDPVSRVNSLDFVRASLSGLVQRVGGEQAFQEHYAVNVDSHVLEGFQRLGQPRDMNI